MSGKTLVFRVEEGKMFDFSIFRNGYLCFSMKNTKNTYSRHFPGYNGNFRLKKYVLYANFQN